MDLLKSLVGPAILSTIIPLIVSMLQNRKIIHLVTLQERERIGEKKSGKYQRR